MSFGLLQSVRVPTTGSPGVRDLASRDVGGLLEKLGGHECPAELDGRR